MQQTVTKTLEEYGKTSVCYIKQQNKSFCTAKNSWKRMTPEAIQFTNTLLWKNNVDRAKRYFMMYYEEMWRFNSSSMKYKSVSKQC